MSTPTQMGRLIRVLRTERGLSQAAVAKRAKITREYVNKIEAGHYDPTVGVLQRIAKALGVRVAELLALNASRSTGPLMTDFFLPSRRGWLQRSLFGGVPLRPTTGDPSPVIDALSEIADAAGGLEHSRAQLARITEVAQKEFDDAVLGLPSLWDSNSWGGANTPAVYLEFGNAVAWARAVDDRYGHDRLRRAVRHDPGLWRELQKIRHRTAASQLEDARRLAKVSLHKYTPPYTAAGARIENGRLIYPVPIIIDADDYLKNRLVAGRHVISVVDDLWAAVEKFVDQLLDVFYPRNP